ncbi:MAG: hypothetical protein NkDv07_0910 [Candidatus Improbicoccus devescovinae]|nr:MAG: hypothetical protein NkDv07_0910 [Candidatus Improbicoccus devescovinae]
MLSQECQEQVLVTTNNLAIQPESNESNQISSPEAKRIKWAGFVESLVLDFFNEHEIERLTIEDGDGNKAKLSRFKEYEIKVEYSSVVML